MYANDIKYLFYGICYLNNLSIVTGYLNNKVSLAFTLVIIYRLIIILCIFTSVVP